SNHDPFEFPDNKIELYEQPKQTRNNAAKYADFALGYFFEMAKKSDYWKDTIFLVVADHDSRVSGASLVPIQHFHIPGLILGEGIEAKRD
ncbi:sulfatase-like hydrolase/transferase, partial [Chryseobacterium gambrini]